MGYPRKGTPPGHQYADRAKLCPQKGITMSSYKGRHGQPLAWIESQISQELAAFKSGARHLRSGSGGGGSGNVRFRGSCSEYAATLKSQIIVRRVDEFLEEPESPAALCRRFSSRIITTKPDTLVYPVPSFEPSLIFVQRGIIELFTICKRRPVAIRRVVTGDVFGDAPLFDMSMFGSRARAVTDCRFICVPTAVIVSAARASHHLSLKWWIRVTPNLTELREQVIAMRYASVRQRLAGLLLKLADDEGVVSGVDQLAIAGRLEVRRETVSSRLSKMKSEGIVRVSREMITILDRDRMREIASFREEAT